MQATVSRLNDSLGICEACTDNELLIAFTPPAGAFLMLSHRIDFGELKLDSENEVQNLATGTRFVVRIAANNVHDLRLPARHGSSRTPTPERIRSR